MIWNSLNSVKNAIMKIGKERLLLLLEILGLEISHPYKTISKLEKDKKKQKNFPKVSSKILGL